MLRLAVLISGRGSNLRALMEYCGQDDVGVEIVLIAADRDAAGLTLPQPAPIETALIDQKRFSSRVAFEEALRDSLDRSRADLICLAGFMQVLSPEFCRYFAGRLINIHPSLLPDFPGLDTHRRAITSGRRHHGCTVHAVTAQIDAGAIIGQKRLTITEQDTPETLAERVLALEHVLYPMVIGAFAEGLIRLDALSTEIEVEQRRGEIKGRLPDQPYPLIWHPFSAIIDA